MGNGQTDDENWKYFITFVRKFKSMILLANINF